MRTLIAAVLAALTFTAEAQTFGVSGTVVDSETGKPLNRARVALSGEPAGAWSAVTAADGGFSFNVPQGKYALAAAHRDWGDVYGEPVPGSDSGTAVIAGPDSDTTQLLFRFRAPIAVHGKIVDDSGEPVPSATVEMFHQTVVGGRKRLNSLGRAESNDFGDYSYSWLPAGTYYLAAAGEPWYLTDLFNADDELTRSGTPPVPYGAVYFPGTTDPGGATPLVLRPGADFRADFILRPAAGANLFPKCGGAEPCGGGGGSFMLHAIGPGRAETLIRPCESGCHDLIPAVPPGRYVLRYNGPEGAARTVIDVQGGDIPIEIVPKPAPTLAGRVTFRNPADRPRHPLYVNLVDEDSGEPVAVTVKPDGSFSWPAVTAARVRLYLSGLDGFFIARMSVEGAIVKNGVIEVVDGASVRVDLLASGETGRVNGFVKDDEKPAPAVLVVLAPSSEGFDPYRYFASQAGSDGSFDFPNIPAGDYVLFAVNNPEFEYADADAVLPYLARAKRVRVQPHGSSTENIGLASAARN